MTRRNLGFQKIRKSLRRGIALTLAAVSLTGLLAGCTGTAEEKPGAAETTAAPAGPTVPADGNPQDVTCKGSYTADTLDRKTVVAEIDGQKLTLGMLNVLYRLEINEYTPEEGTEPPDFSAPLDTQRCGAPYENLTWQQFFLQKALDRWHTLQALERKSREITYQDEENFEVDEKLHEEYMKDMPINDTVLYGKESTFRLSKMQTAFLDGIPDQLEALAQEKGGTMEDLLAREFGSGILKEDLEETAWLMNYAYMYFIELTYDMKPTDSALLAQINQLSNTGETVVDMRHILMRPEGSWTADGKVTADEAAWEQSYQDAKGLMERFQNHWRKIPAEFGILAHDYSDDDGSRLNGGLYSEIHKGQMTEPLDQWLFDPARVPGELGLVKSDYGWHVLYFQDRRDARTPEAQKNYLKACLTQELKAAKANYPVKNVEYDQILLLPVKAQGTVTTAGNLLYPDIAHERFPEVPVYIQQDYKKAPYGGYKVSSHGCGISALAMLSTYMTDEVLTPGGLAARYGSYNSKSGTDQMILMRVPPELGYFTLKKTSNWAEVEAALKEGKKAISLQVKGYFTRGGHYLVISELLDNGNVILRDSNVYNYKRLKEHAQDEFPPQLLFPNGQGFWIFDNKIVRIPACIRCGTPDSVTDLFREDYFCPRCRSAMARRSLFLELTEKQ